MSFSFRLLCTGNETFEAMLQAIDAASESVRLEMYIFQNSPIGDRFRDALVRAARRGLKVRVLVDGWGSYMLPGNYFEPLVKAGGEFRVFNPIRWDRCFFRDHRKLLVCDEKVAFVGGSNIAREWCGDGVSGGWCDLGLQLRETFCLELARAFDYSFRHSAMKHRLVRLRKSRLQKRLSFPEGDLIFSGPGWTRNHFRRALREDLRRARNVQIVAAYFLPTWRLRSELMRVARRGGKVQLLLAGKSDVPLSQLASRSLYQRLLRSGIEIYEYGPQILHAKMIIIDDFVYLGSANLDTRSLQINYELMLRMKKPDVAIEARRCFDQMLSHGNRIEPAAWRKSRTFWNKFKERWAYFILARVDLYIAQRQLRSLR